jgi:signal peptidase II
MKKVLLSLSVALGILVADQVTKYLAVSHLTRSLEGKSGLERVRAFAFPGGTLRARGEVRVLEDYFHLRYVENPGAAWGLFADLPDGVRGPFFTAITLLAVGFILWMIRKAERDQWLLQLALALVLGGALGNFLDRLARGYVVDFLDVHWRNQPGMRWPTFNVADIAISVGVAFLLFDAARQTWRHRRMAAGAPAPVEPPGA